MLDIVERIKEESIRTQFKDYREKRIINIFDIDGTILKNIFPKLEKKNTAKEDQTTISKFRTKLKDLDLFPDFIDYYKSTKNHLHNFFITGRKAIYFSDITQQQLSPLKVIKTFTLFHNHLNKKTTLENYNKFKSTMTNSVILDILKNYKNSKIEIRIFDDDLRYFDLISKDILTSIKGKILPYHIKSNECWKVINNMEVLQCVL